MRHAALGGRGDAILSATLMSSSLRFCKYCAFHREPRLEAASPPEVEQILPYLQARAADYTQDARKLLADRSYAEAKAMREP